MIAEEIDIYEEKYKKFIAEVRRVGKALGPLHIRLSHPKAIASACIHKEDVVCFVYSDYDEYCTCSFPKTLLTYTDDELETYANQKIKEKELKEEEQMRERDLEVYYRIKEKYK